MLKLTLTSGETITGAANYVTPTHVEIRTTRTDIGRYRWVRRDRIARTQAVRARRSDSDAG